VNGIAGVAIPDLTKGTDYCVYTALSPGSGDADMVCFTTDDVPTAGPIHPFAFSA
jgi:hypothetical protein